MTELEKILSPNNEDRKREKELINIALIFLLGNYTILILSCLITSIIGIVFLIYKAFLSVGHFPVITYIMPVFILATILGIVKIIHSLIKSIFPKANLGQLDKL